MRYLEHSKQLNNQILQHKIDNTSIVDYCQNNQREAYKTVHRIKLLDAILNLSSDEIRLFYGLEEENLGGQNGK